MIEEITFCVKGHRTRCRITVGWGKYQLGLGFSEAARDITVLCGSLIGRPELPEHSCDEYVMAPLSKQSP